jgi:hypothetical protein
MLKIIEGCIGSRAHQLLRLIALLNVLCLKMRALFVHDAHVVKLMKERDLTHQVHHLFDKLCINILTLLANRIHTQMRLDKRPKNTQ